MFFHGSFWHLRARMLAPRSENGDRETLERQSYANLQTDLEGKRNCSFQCWLICMKINLAQTLCSFIQHPRKEEKSQLQQSNTSRGANRSNEWDQKIEKGVADAQIKHVLKKRSGICLSCRSKTYHLKWLQKHLFVVDTAENYVKFDDVFGSRLALSQDASLALLHIKTTWIHARQLANSSHSWHQPNRQCRGSFSTSKVTVRIRADAVASSHLRNRLNEKSV